MSTLTKKKEHSVLSPEDMEVVSKVAAPWARYRDDLRDKIQQYEIELTMTKAALKAVEDNLYNIEKKEKV